MTIEATTDNRTATIKIIGRFDFSSQRDFRNAYQGQDQAVEKFVVDFSQTEYIDSSALGMLLLLKEYVESKKGSTELSKPAPEIRKIFTMSNFDQLFKISD